jgi:diguanylate cyclase (GGDEF)-like protein/PAS domain S-box-containing protein
MKVKHRLFVIFIFALLLILAANYFYFQQSFQNSLNGHEEVILTGAAIAGESSRILIISLGLSVVCILILFYCLLRFFIHKPIDEIADHLEKIDVLGNSGFKALEGRNRDEFSKIREGINRLIKGLTDNISKITKYLDMVGSLIVVMDAEGNVVRANRECCETLGVTEDEIVGKNWVRSFIPERIQGYVREVMDNLLVEDTPKSGRVENHIVTSGGQERLISWVNAVLFDDNGKVAGIIASGEDVTEKRSIHNMIAQNARRLKKTEEIAHIGSWDLNVKTGEVMWSDEFYRICGYKPGAVEPSFRNVMARIHPDDRKQFEKLFNRATHHRSTYETKMRIVRMDGEVRWVLSKGVMDISEPDILMGSILDITGINEAEKQIRQNVELSENLVRILQYNAESITDLLEYALNEAVKITDSKIGYIYFYDEDKQEFEMKIWSREVLAECRIEPRGTCLLKDAGVWGDAVRQRRAIVLNDYPAPGPDAKGYPLGHVRIKKFLTVPTFSNDRIVAVIGVANKESDYSQSDILKLTLVMNSVWEVVERIRTDILLKEERERLRITLLSVGDGVISTDKNGNIEMINEVAQRLTGWSRRDAIGKPFDEVFHIVHEYTREKCDSPVQKVLMTGKIIELRNHTLLISRDGTERPVADSAAPILDESGTIHGVVMVFRDFTEEKRKKDEIEYLSYHDQLTGVFNRRYYEEELRRMDNSENLPLSVIMSDVNGLKLTNDAFGHAVGDKLLQAAARVLRSTCRQGDIIARLGGDEFIILLPRTGTMEAEKIVSRIRQAISTVEVDSVMLSISFGWDVKVDVSDSIADVIKKAEDNMYTCKLFESPSMRGQTVYTIINTLHEKNVREKNHSERVSRLCELMGHALALNEKGVKELKTAGLLHDIGKVAISEKVLDKVGKLTKDEWEEIKRHPEIGFRILGAVNDMTELASFVLAHHERWDGRGYPKGLSGEGIPLQSRIISIADAYDAMTSERPYRSALPEEVAIAEIMKNAGTQFDPDLARLFVEKVLRYKQEEPRSVSV